MLNLVQHRIDCLQKDGNLKGILRFAQNDMLMKWMGTLNKFRLTKVTLSNVVLDCSFGQGQK
jgi:hypothetical protein